LRQVLLARHSPGRFALLRRSESDHVRALTRLGEGFQAVFADEADKWKAREAELFEEVMAPIRSRGRS
jgi:hypothetical protein